MWFNKKKNDAAAQQIVKAIEAIPEGVMRQALMKSELYGKRLTDEALTLRALGDYESAIKYLYYSVNVCGYLSATSILGNTLIASQGLEAGLQYFENIVEDVIEKRSPVALEIFANLAGNCRGKLKMFDVARSWIHKGRLFAEDLGDFENKDALTGALDIEEAYLEVEAGNIAHAKILLEKRFLSCPECKMAINLREHLCSSGQLDYYVLLTEPNKTFVNIDLLNKVEVRLLRGFEYELFSSSVLSFFGMAKWQGWNSAGLWKNVYGGKAILRFILPVEVNQDEAIQLTDILRKIPRSPNPALGKLYEELDRFIVFTSRGAFSCDEAPGKGGS